MMEEKQHIDSCAIIILAAGKSTRLGRAKQLLTIGENSLIRHAAETALSSGLGPVLVVLGSSEELITSELSGLDVRIVENSMWEEGMASSIRSGLKELMEFAPQSDGCIIMVCDQPLVSNELLRRLLNAQHKSGKPIVASQYDEAIGTPALFHHSLYSTLLGLKGDRGAKKIMELYPELTETVAFPEGKWDIDTESDYLNFQKWNTSPTID
jgi:molybdenum cofactor cytidylyltransferase